MFYIQSGKYCGSVEGVVDVTVDLSAATGFNLKATIMGSEIECNGEPYTFDESSGKVTIPGIDNPDDCIGKVADEFGITADTVDITYSAASNSIKIDIGFGSVELKSCPATAAGWEVLLIPHVPNFKRFHPHHPKDAQPTDNIVEMEDYHHGNHHHCHCKGCAFALIGFVTLASVFLGKRLRRRCKRAQEGNKESASVAPAGETELGIPLVAEASIKQ